MRPFKRRYLTHKQMLALSQAEPGDQPLPGWHVPFPGTRFYGGNGTIHRTGELDIETYQGTVIAVWFRCQQLPFRQVTIDLDRAAEIAYPPMLPGVEIVGVELAE